jgi:hypothetical protein
MEVDDIREAIRATMRASEVIWGVASPFVHRTTWIGYAETKEINVHLQKVLGHADRPVPKRDPKHDDIVKLIREILPAPGRDAFDSGEYAEQTIYVDPVNAVQPWTPSIVVVTMATDPETEVPFVLLEIVCGSPKP